MQIKQQTGDRRLLTLKEAAHYCGVSVPMFEKHCPLRPVALGPGPRLRRFDRQNLDHWIDDLGNGLRTEKDWLAELDRSHDGHQN